MKTRTAVLYRPGEAIRVEEVELDPPKDHEVQVKMVAAGICHSDYHIVVGDLPAYLPIALGHEGAGIVEEVGPGVTNCKPGDHVVLSFIPSCGQCYYCTRGHTNLCNMGAAILMGPQLDGTFRMHTAQGEGVGQMCVISTFSERSVVPDMSVVKVADYYPLEKAKEFGATHTINAKNQDVVQISKDLTWGMGVDYAFEAIATPATIGQAYACTGKNGTVVVIGLTPATAESIPVPPLDLVLFQKTLMGTLYGDSQPRNDIPNLLAMYHAGKIKLDELITRTYTLDQINEAYADMVAGKNIRGVIEFA